MSYLKRGKSLGTSPASVFTGQAAARSSGRLKIVLLNL